MAMRDEIFMAINKGGATRESLLALTGTTEKGLASQFTYLRMMGKCPMKQEDGTYKIVSAEDWAEHRNSSGISSVLLTPEQRLDKAEKRSKRATVAYDNAKKKAETNSEDKLSQLKYVKAETELQITEIELGRIQIVVDEQPEVADTEEDEITEIEENEVEVAADTEGRNDKDIEDELNFDDEEFQEGLD